MKSSPEITAIVLCAGKGERAGQNGNKLFSLVGGQAVAAMTAAKFARFDRLIAVVAPAETEEMRALLPPCAEIVAGGKTRTESVRNALAAIGDTDIAVIHDGARPFVTDKILDEAIASAIEFGSGVAATKAVESLKIATDDGVKSLDRSKVYCVQTPQAFCFADLKAAYERVAGDLTDDSEVMERAGYPVRLTAGSPDNRKLTYPADFNGLNDAYRIGLGYDVHPTAKDRKLVLCGETFDADFGLAGHSDADAPVHAIMDALLSAAGMPDIGVLFPDTDPAYLGADSMELLRTVKSRCAAFEIINLSVCIMAQRPKIAPRVSKMRDNLAAALGVPRDNVNISATTTEGLGIVGEGRGIASAAVVLMRTK